MLRAIDAYVVLRGVNPSRRAAPRRGRPLRGGRQRRLGGTTRVIVAAAVMGTGVYGTQRLLPTSGSWSGHLFSLTALCGAGGVFYLVAAAVLRCHELGWLLRRR